MKTISFKIKVDENLQKVISEDSRVNSDMYRYSDLKLEKFRFGGAKLT